MCFFGTALTFLGDVQGQTWAAWVQAIGSIAAIYATGRAVHRAHVLEQTRATEVRLQERIANVNGAFQLVGAAAQIAKKIFEIENGTSQTPLVDQSVIRAEVAVLQRALQKFEVARMESYEITEALLVTETCIETILSTFEYIFSPTYSRQLDPYALRNAAHIAMQETDQRAKRLATLLQKTESMQTLRSN